MESVKSSRPDWHAYMMTIACVAAMRSPDESTKVGAVIADRNHRILALGYNGYPPGGHADIYPRERPEKYKYIIHAEDNAISFSPRPSLDGATIYTTSFPCHRCMGMIIRAGLTKVVYGLIGSQLVDEKSRTEIHVMGTNHDVELTHYQDSSLLLPHGIMLDTINYLNAKGWTVNLSA